MKLDIKTLKLGIIKNLRNSQELIDEAEILFKNKKYARTYLLSHIAIEESSKCAMLLKIIAFYIWEEEIDIKNEEYSSKTLLINIITILFLQSNLKREIIIAKLKSSVNSNINIINSCYTIFVGVIIFFFITFF